MSNSTSKNDTGSILESLKAISDAQKARVDSTISHLIDIYNNIAKASSLFDYLTYASNHYKVNSVQHLVNETDAEYYTIVEILKLLDNLGVGKFIVGRKGKDSRIEWSYHPKSLGEAANKKRSTLLGVPKGIDEYDGGGEDKEISAHSFFLRPNYKLELTLPTNFDRADLKRLEKWLDTIPFD